MSERENDFWLFIFDRILSNLMVYFRLLYQTLNRFLVKCFGKTVSRVLFLNNMKNASCLAFFALACMKIFCMLLMFPIYILHKQKFENVILQTLFLLVVY